MAKVTVAVLLEGLKRFVEEAHYEIVDGVVHVYDIDGSSLGTIDAEGNVVHTRVEEEKARNAAEAATSTDTPS